MTRLRVAASVLLCGALAVSGCSAPGREVPLCPAGVTAVTVYNHYGTHPLGDVQEVPAGDVTDLCQSMWATFVGTPRPFEAPALNERSTTVLVMRNGTTVLRTVWLHRLSGFDAGTALYLDTGESYLLEHQNPQPYYAATASPIAREKVPQH